MTNLPVFEDLSGDLYIQISAVHLALSQKLFVGAAKVPDAKASHANPAEIVHVPFKDGMLAVFFLVVASVRTDYVAVRFKQIGQLEETDSINILNHIVDILGYP